MMEEEMICLRYARNGLLIERHPLDTMLERLVLEQNDDVSEIRRRLFTGHHYPLGDGSWLELENRHV